LIREAAPSDIHDIARLGEKFHAAAGWDEIEYNAVDCAVSLRAFMESGAFICLVAEVAGKIVGMASGVISPVYFNRQHVSGEELFWWVSDDAPQMTGIRLLERMEDLAKTRGCDTWQMKSLARLGGERMTRLYERRGYRASEQTFIKRL
jgi:GNAT superfamily N-acetyltransferase